MQVVYNGPWDMIWPQHEVFTNLPAASALPSFSYLFYLFIVRHQHARS